MTPRDKTILIVVTVILFVLVLAAIITAIVVSKRNTRQRVTVLSRTETVWDDGSSPANLVLNRGPAPVGPDFVVSSKTAADSMYTEIANISPTSCAIQEGLLDTPGRRKLLRFSTRVINIGTGPMILGDPTGNPGFEFSPCHGHYHFHGFSEYILLDESATIVITSGHKQAFCLRDNTRMFNAIDGVATPSNASYDCSDQGLSVGWADDYLAHLDGQWIDVTDVLPGTYTLRIVVNTPVILMDEIQTDNNSIDIQFVLT